MENKCVNCGGELIAGMVAGAHGLCFYPDGELKKLKPKRSKIACDCCKECGAIQNMRATEIDNIK